MLRKIRLVAALLFFTMITLLFLDFTGTVHRSDLNLFHSLKIASKC